MQSMGTFLVVAGILMVVIGLALILSDRIPFLGRLPGDIRVEKENFRLYIPIATSIVLSVVISIILWLINHFRK
jgi:hypothetical protein